MEGKIAAGAVATAKIRDGAVTSAKIANGSIIVADIALRTITGANIVNGSIADADLASGISGSKIAGSLSVETVTADSFRYATPKTGRVVVTPMDFEPDDSTVAHRTFATGLYSATNSQQFFYAPFAVPTGATVTGATAYAEDYSAARDISFSLNWAQQTGDGGQMVCSLFSAVTSGAPGETSGDLVDTTLPCTPVADNDSRYFYVLISLWGEEGSNTKVNKVVVRYEYQSP